MLFLILNPFLIWQTRRRPRNELNKLLLSPGVVSITFLQAEYRATEANITPLFIKNRKSRSRLKRLQQ